MTLKKKILVVVVALALVATGAWAYGKQVVVAPTGKKYHYPSCRTLHGQFRYLTEEQAQAEGYSPCKVCMN